MDFIEYLIPLLWCGFGGIMGWFVANKNRPDVREYKRALEMAEENLKSQRSRFTNRLREYEQPSELMQIANKQMMNNPGDLVTMLANNLSSIKGIPGWIRPFIPGIQSYIKENPDQVNALIQQFTKQAGGKLTISEETL